jgi:alpha-galactosidase
MPHRDSNLQALPVVECRFSRNEPDLLTPLEASFWSEADWQEVTCQWNGDPADEKWRTAFASKWTPRFVYFAFTCQYEELTTSCQPNLRTKTQQLWNKEDVVEIFLSPDIRHLDCYKEFELSPSSQWIDIDIDRSRNNIDFEWISGMEGQSAVDATHHLWSGTFRVPLGAFKPAELKEDVTVALNAYRVELKSDLFLAWNPTCTPQPNFHVPAQFGRMRFLK